MKIEITIDYAAHNNVYNNLVSQNEEIPNYIYSGIHATNPKDENIVKQCIEKMIENRSKYIFRPGKDPSMNVSQNGKNMTDNLQVIAANQIKKYNFFLDTEQLTIIFEKI